MSETSPSAVPVVTAITVNPVKILSSLASEVRWRAMHVMASGATISASELAAMTGLNVDSAGKHLRVMHAAGAVDWRAGEDSRFSLYFIPQRLRPQPGVVDYGFCRLQFPVIKH